MPEPKQCPNGCGNILEQISETEFYCSKCDISFKMAQGKVKVEYKGALKDMQIQIAELQNNQKKLLEVLFGSADADDLKDWGFD